MTATISSRFDPVRAMRAHEHIVEQLQRLILSGELPPGSRLPSERAMMAQFHVSRPTVREALRVAENMGLVAVRHGDPGGPVVLGAPSVGISRVLDGMLRAERASAAELLELRMSLDSTAATLASAQPKSKLAKIDQVLRQMREAEDFASFVSLDARFHYEVAVASGNRLLPLVLQALEQPIHGLIHERLRSGKFEIVRDSTVRQHAEIAAAIQNGDAKKASQAARRHLRDVYFPALTASERSRLESLG